MQYFLGDNYSFTSLARALRLSVKLHFDKKVLFYIARFVNNYNVRFLKGLSHLCHDGTRAGEFGSTCFLSLSLSSSLFPWNFSLLTCACLELSEALQNLQATDLAYLRQLPSVHKAVANLHVNDDQLRFKAGKWLEDIAWHRYELRNRISAST